MTTQQPARWLSPVPGFCEICEMPIHKVFYDAGTKSQDGHRGPWACMCKNCFTFGPGVGKLGLGLGQEYTEQGKYWIKTGG